MTQPTDWLEQAKREIAQEWREYQQFIGKQVPRQSTICADWTQRHLEAERARNLELRERVAKLETGEGRDGQRNS